MSALLEAAGQGTGRVVACCNDCDHRDYEGVECGTDDEALDPVAPDAPLYAWRSSRGRRLRLILSPPRRLVALGACPRGWRRSSRELLVLRARGSDAETDERATLGRERQGKSEDGECAATHAST